MSPGGQPVAILVPSWCGPSVNSVVPSWCLLYCTSGVLQACTLFWEVAIFLTIFRSLLASCDVCTCHLTSPVEASPHPPAVLNHRSELIYDMFCHVLFSPIMSRNCHCMYQTVCRVLRQRLKMCAKLAGYTWALSDLGTRYGPHFSSSVLPCILPRKPSPRTTC